jgi:hypothetical protein
MAETRKCDIFIGYCHSEQYGHACALRDELSSNTALDVFTSPNLEAGALWPAEMEWRLNECSMFVMLVCREGLKRPWCRAEYMRADERKVLIHPVWTQQRTTDTTDEVIKTAVKEDCQETWYPDLDAHRSGLRRLLDETQFQQKDGKLFVFSLDEGQKQNNLSFLSSDIVRRLALAAVRQHADVAGAQQASDPEYAREEKLADFVESALKASKALLVVDDSDDASARLSWEAYGCFEPPPWWHHVKDISTASKCSVALQYRRIAQVLLVLDRMVPLRAGERPVDWSRCEESNALLQAAEKSDDTSSAPAAGEPSTDPSSLDTNTRIQAGSEKPSTGQQPRDLLLAAVRELEAGGKTHAVLRITRHPPRAEKIGVPRVVWRELVHAPLHERLRPDEGAASLPWRSRGPDNVTYTNQIAELAAALGAPDSQVYLVLGPNFGQRELAAPGRVLPSGPPSPISLGATGPHLMAMQLPFNKLFIEGDLAPFQFVRGVQPTCDVAGEKYLLPLCARGQRVAMLTTYISNSVSSAAPGQSSPSKGTPSGVESRHFIIDSDTDWSDRQNVVSAITEVAPVGKETPVTTVWTCLGWHGDLSDVPTQNDTCQPIRPPVAIHATVTDVLHDLLLLLSPRR